MLMLIFNEDRVRGMCMYILFFFCALMLVPTTSENQPLWIRREYTRHRHVYTLCNSLYCMNWLTFQDQYFHDYKLCHVLKKFSLFCMKSLYFSKPIFSYTNIYCIIFWKSNTCKLYTTDHTNYCANYTNY